MVKKQPFFRIFKHFHINREFKDRLFKWIFSNKSDLLELYNAINHTHYTNPDELEINTLEDAIFISMKNDLYFIISASMNLYEHQSTFCPNIPMRGIFYFSKLYENYINKMGWDLYGSTPLTLPIPQFIVFYNGRKPQPDEVILRLSDLFQKNSTHSVQPALECRARMININPGHNPDVLYGCKRLNDYSIFVDMINKNISKESSLENAIQKAMDYCIHHDILADILSKSRNEVMNMLLTEYDEEIFF